MHLSTYTNTHLCTQTGAPMCTETMLNRRDTYVYIYMHVSQLYLNVISTYEQQMYRKKPNSTKKAPHQTAKNKSMKKSVSILKMNGNQTKTKNKTSARKLNI